MIYDNKKVEEVSDIGDSDYNSRANSNMIKSNRYTEVDNNILVNPIEGYDQNVEINNNNINNNANSNTENKVPKTKSFRKPTVEKYKFKIILLGEIGVGKTSLIARYVYNKELKEINTVPDISNKKVDLDENYCANISIYDTTTQEKLQKFTKDFYRDVHGALIVFDLFNKESLQKVHYWINELKTNGPKDVVYGIIGNKSDTTEGEKVNIDSNAKEEACFFYEVSAINGINVSLSFEQLVYAIIEKQTKEENNPDKVLRGKEARKSMDLKDSRRSSTQPRKGCC